MREEYRESDPRGIIAVCLAANSLQGQGEIAPPGDPGDVLMTVSRLRAAAIGWRETAMLFSCPYDNRKPRDARHDRALCFKYAREADNKADRLCMAIGLPFEYVGSYQADARLFWQAFKNLYAEVNDHKTTWGLIASGGSSVEAIGLPFHFGQDIELMHYARQAFYTLHALHSSQLAAIQKARIN